MSTRLARPLLVSLVAGSVLAFAACGSSGSGGSDQAPIDGSWKGTLKGTGNATFEGYVEIDTLREGSVSGTVYFPGPAGAGPCSGALIYKGRSGSDYLFEENLVARANPACVKLGDVKISTADDGDAIAYSWTSGKNNASGTLKEWDDRGSP